MIHFGPGKVTIGGKVIGEFTSAKISAISKLAEAVKGYVNVKIEPASSPTLLFQIADPEAYEHWLRTSLLSSHDRLHADFDFALSRTEAARLARESQDRIAETRWRVVSAGRNPVGETVVAVRAPCRLHEALSELDFIRNVVGFQHVQCWAMRVE